MRADSTAEDGEIAEPGKLYPSVALSALCGLRGKMVSLGQNIGPAGFEPALGSDVGPAGFEPATS